MNKIDKLFSEKNKNILSVYFTAGFPNLEDTVPTIDQLIANSADLIEIGIPFSDPLADGPTIQQSSQRALENGMSIRVLFQQLEKMEKTETPLILMSYLNPILQYGIGKFCEKAFRLGISGLIVPDLPLPEFLTDHKLLFEQNGLKNIFLITPQTTEERIRMIDDCSDSFIYMVASGSTTGSRNGISAEQEAYFNRIREMKLKNPVLAGFGISDHKSFNKVCEYANGAIIGSAFIEAVGKGGQGKAITEFINSILQKEILQ
ncbi:MAG: tryptophan synthase subunit alpha [Bacteroidia bacterium]